MDNYFTIFDFEVSYAIDQEQLKAKYLELQQKYHPDKNKDLGAASLILTINQAYKILSNDVERAIYLLKMHNVYIGEESNAVRPSNNLLTEIFELREQIYELEDIKQLNNIHQQLVQKIKQQSLLFAENFPKDLSQSANIALVMQYYNKTIHDLKILKNKLLG